MKIIITKAGEKHLKEMYDMELECKKCGNTTDFEIVFNESFLVVDQRGGDIHIKEWGDNGADREWKCLKCGSDDVIPD